jgi:hypothetical protein
MRLRSSVRLFVRRQLYIKLLFSSLLFNPSLFIKTPKKENQVKQYILIHIHVFIYIYIYTFIYLYIYIYIYKYA